MRERVGMRLVPLVSSEPTTTSKCPERSVEKASSTVSRRLARDDAEPAAFLLQRRQQVDHPRAVGELGVQRLVVLAVGRRELVDPVAASNTRICSSDAGPPTARPAPRPGCRGRARSSSRAGIEARMIAPESITVPSKSKRTTGKRIYLMLRASTARANGTGGSHREVIRITPAPGVALPSYSAAAARALAASGADTFRMPSGNIFCAYEHYDFAPVDLRCARSAARCGRCRRGPRPAATRPGAEGYAMRQRGPAHVLCITDTVYEPEGEDPRLRHNRHAASSAARRAPPGLRCVNSTGNGFVLTGWALSYSLQGVARQVRRLQDAVREHRLRLVRSRPHGVDDAGSRAA